ncbi:3-hydroxyacyl-CoA dehydrogenase NAD-binding domain-containing protein [Alterisphingorhabdus coralli]|uniref:3-hydroxyacyl-CoA dehydrogenase NAD-binding domain-containing protein n=1 Tax=Alterisphingorhabdus coralli TaxID=3071408 RepID=A0AA97F8R7_9SPHN|nr:3-hydroxyacyl-CoA dehydrogenase NAD-binding domain-containing protein [Parasphingorhabdus sp. SCSIO 66989]WOE75591.1 3-hydroxyacyl-CoA dehydrogenase NAD-binding domain-containing protein [Parasphingorhabdus sp. SCSIO 66989]
MTYKAMTVDIDGDGIALVTIDLPGQSMNVWNADLIEDFNAFVEDLNTNDALKGAVITSGKETGFLAGADLNMLGSSKANSMAEAFESAFGLNATLRKMESGGHAAKALIKGAAHAKPVAAAINGLALGGGLELALACHYRVVADNPKIQLGLPEVQVGLLPGGGGTQRLPRLMGLQASAMMLLQGQPANPQAALAQGIVDEVVPANDVVAKAKEWVKANPKAAAPWDKKGYKVPGGAGSMNPAAAQFFVGANAMANKQSKGNYAAVKAIMSCLYEGTQLPIDTALRVESKYFTKLLSGPQAKNMIRTLFINKQAAEKGASRPEGVPKTELKKVGVLGGGLMGSGITHVTAKGGMDVVVLDRSVEEATKAVTYSQKIVDKKVARGKMTQEKADAFMARITPTDNYDDLKDVDLIIEAVFERPDVKADVIKKTEAVIRDDVIFASNTSTLPITGLAKNSKRPEQFIGLHFFSPVEKMPLLEIIPGEETGDKALAVAFDYNARIRKTPIVVKDVRGFYTNRVFPPYAGEAMLMVGEGVSMALIENAAVQMGMPIGPLAVVDETTLKLGYDVMQSTKEELGDDYQPSGNEELFELMVNKLGRSGRRFGGGFYDYDDSGKKTGLWKGMTDHFPLAEQQPSVEEVKQRLMFIQLIATAQCFDEEVIKDPQSADLGAIFGWGFAPWTGGPMSHIDTMGVDNFVRIADNLAQKHGERFKPPMSFRDKADKGESFYKAA